MEEETKAGCSPHLLFFWIGGLPGGAMGSRIPGLVLLLGQVESGLGLRVEVEGRGSLAGLSGSCTSSGHR